MCVKNFFSKILNKTTKVIENIQRSNIGLFNEIYKVLKN